MARIASTCLTLAGIFAALSGLAGCVTTDANGKPVAREVKAKPDAMEAALANATLDGSRVVASGRPPIAFLYPGSGRLSIRDLNTSYIPFSIEPTAELGPKTLIAISADGKVTGTATGESGPKVTDVAAVDRSHVFVITYQATEPAGTLNDRNDRR